jgi:hypothetical protein
LWLWLWLWLCIEQSPLSSHKASVVGLGSTVTNDTILFDSTSQTCSWICTKIESKSHTHKEPQPQTNEMEPQHQCLVNYKQEERPHPGGLLALFLLGWISENGSMLKSSLITPTYGADCQVLLWLRPVIFQDSMFWKLSVLCSVVVVVVVGGGVQVKSSSLGCWNLFFGCAVPNKFRWTPVIILPPRL